MSLESCRTGSKENRESKTRSKRWNRICAFQSRFKARFDSIDSGIPRVWWVKERYRSKSGEQITRQGICPSGLWLLRKRS